MPREERARQEAIFELIFSELCFRDEMRRTIKVFDFFLKILILI